MWFYPKKSTQNYYMKILQRYDNLSSGILPFTFLTTILTFKQLSPESSTEVEGSLSGGSSSSWGFSSELTEGGSCYEEKKSMHRKNMVFLEKNANKNKATCLTYCKTLSTEL